MNDEDDLPPGFKARDLTRRHMSATPEGMRETVTMQRFIPRQAQPPPEVWFRVNGGEWQRG